MNFDDCIKFANENPICFFATVEGDQPRVRALGFWFADKTGFYFQTGSTKEFPKQLQANPKVEVCFYKHTGIIGTMMRVAGKVTLINDVQFKQKVINERPFLKTFGMTAESQELLIYCIPHGAAHFWNMQNNLKPKEYIEF